MNKEFKATLRFVGLIATPLCLINGLIFSVGSQDLIAIWLRQFGFSLLITFPQAVVYVSIVKWFDKKNET